MVVGMRCLAAQVAALSTQLEGIRGPQGVHMCLFWVKDGCIAVALLCVLLSRGLVSLSFFGLLESE